MGRFGKTPTERDFVRVNAGAFLRAGLDRWFQEGVEQLRSERSQLPAEPAHFLFVPATGTVPFAGAFAPGQDAVGRIFPVIVFAALDSQPQADLSLIPLRLGSFYRASARLATAAHALTTAQLTSEIHALASDLRPPASLADVEAGLLRSSSSDLRAALGGLPEAAAYALSTVIAACSQTKARPPESPAYWFSTAQPQLTSCGPSGWSWCVDTSTPRRKSCRYCGRKRVAGCLSGLVWRRA